MPPVSARALARLVPELARRAAAWDDARLAAQVFLWGFAGAEPDPHLEEAVAGGLGGVILFARNATHPAAAARLSARLRALARDAGQPPPLVAVDQEGGPVARLREGVSVLPAPMALGAAGGPGLAARAGALTGVLLRAAGVHVNLAPVADVDDEPDNPVIGVRSFGADPRRVARHVAAWVRAQQAEGVAATAKHFPGHGATRVDSHHGLPVVARDRAGLEQVDLPPFRAAVAAGVACVMAAHVAFPALEPEPGLPATLSRAILTGLLRGELGFRGVVLTDCMEMGALRGRDPGAAAVAALAAGADLLVYSHTPELQREARAAVLAGLRRGRLARERVVEAAARVLALKAALGLLGPDGESAAGDDPEAAAAAAAAALGRWVPAAAALAAAVARRSLTAHGPWRPPPRQARVLVLDLAPARDAGGAGSGLPATGPLAARLAPHAPAWAFAGLAGAGEAVAQVRVGEWAAVVVVTYASTAAGGREAVEAVLAARPDAWRVVVGAPRDALSPPTGPVLVGYDETPATLDALAEALLGELRPAGRWPW